MRRNAWLACALALACAGAPEADPGRALVFGSVRLVPKAGAELAPAAYGDRRLRDVERVDYQQPGFSVVFADASGSARTRRRRRSRSRRTPGGVRFAPALRGHGSRPRRRGHERVGRDAYRLRAGGRLRAVARARRDGAHRAPRGRGARAARARRERGAGGRLRGAGPLRGGRAPTAATSCAGSRPARSRSAPGIRACRSASASASSSRRASAARSTSRSASTARRSTSREGRAPRSRARGRRRRARRRTTRRASRRSSGASSYLEDELARTRGEWRAADATAEAALVDRSHLALGQRRARPLRRPGGLGAPRRRLSRLGRAPLPRRGARRGLRLGELRAGAQHRPHRRVEPGAARRAATTTSASSTSTSRASSAARG